MPPARPARPDAVLAVVVVVSLAVVVAADGLDDGWRTWAALAFLAVFGVLVLGRRRFPVTMLVASVVALLLYYAAGLPPVGVALPVAASFYTIATLGRLRLPHGAAGRLVPHRRRSRPRHPGVRRLRQGPPMKHRVVVVDDQPLVRGGITQILNRSTDIEVVGEASDGRQAIDVVRRLRPDVVMMDLRMRRLDGVAATAAITGDPAVPVRVLVLTTFDDDELVIAAIRAGASGFLLKDAEPEELRNAVRVVARGDALLSPAVTTAVLHQVRSPTGGPPTSPGSRRSPSARSRCSWKSVADWPTTRSRRPCTCRQPPCGPM